MILDASGRPIGSAAPKRSTANPYSDPHRGWEAGTTNRLNEAHWRGAQGLPINVQLAHQLPLLRARCELEAQQNPLIEGVIGTHLTDTVGPDGPRLQVMSDSDAYSRALEDVWTEWWEMPDINGVLAGVDLLGLAVRSLWTAGDFLWQFVDAGADWMVSLRLLDIHTRRLATPPDRIMDTVLGVKRNRTGRPLSYYVEEHDESEQFLPWTGRWIEIPAEQAIHGFRPLESQQARGVPLLAVSLQPAGDLRDYDDQVLDAARAAADYSVLATTEHPDADFKLVNEETEIQRRTIRFMPPGYKLEQLKAEQPTTNYVEYRKEKQRDVGRPVGMPLMTIRLDSSNHNYSSARFDSQVYQAQIKAFRGWLARSALNRLVKAVAREADLAGLLPPQPDRVRLSWIWAAFPHVDPGKETDAARSRIEGGLSSEIDEVAAIGGDWDELVARRKRVQETLAAAGLSAGAPRKPDPVAKQVADQLEENGRAP